MQFTDTAIRGVHIIDLSRLSDERGFFARAFCVDEFNRRGMVSTTAQCNIANNPTAGTIRGFHYLLAPASEAKVVRCTRGAVFDVVVDLRESSPTYLRHIAVELSAENRRAVYIPPGMAHAYQTLVADSDVFYQVTDIYRPSLERGIRWNDGALNIQWPLKPTLISEKDRNWPALRTARQLELSVGEVVAGRSRKRSRARS